jgi:hypothetical protein
MEKQVAAPRKQKSIAVSQRETIVNQLAQFRYFAAIWVHARAPIVSGAMQFAGRCAKKWKFVVDSLFAHSSQSVGTICSLL